MRKKLVSFLGTGKYTEVSYEYNDNVSKSQNFIQAALVELICEDWTEDDEIVILITEDAKNRNWLNRDEGYMGLEETLKNLNTRAQIKPVDLDNSIIDFRNWEELFNIVFETINTGDEIYFDVTHGFRAFPLLALTILSFTKLVKNVTPKHIFYGNFEARDNDNIAPVVDLDGIYAIEQWTAAVEAFISSGDTTLLSDIIKTDMVSLIRENNNKQNAIIVKDFIVLLDDLTKSIRAVRMDDFPNTLKRTLDQFEKLQQIPSSQFNLIDKLMDKIEDELVIFSGSNVIMDTYAAAVWSNKKGHIQTGFTILDEGLVTAFMLGTGLYHESYFYTNNQRIKYKLEKNIRNVLKSLISFVQQGQAINKMKWLGKSLNMDQYNFLNEKAELLIKNNDLIKETNDLGDLRNNINHAGMAQNDKFDYRELSQKLDELLVNARPFFEAMAEESTKYSVEEVQQNIQAFKLLSEPAILQDEDSTLFVLLSHKLTDKQVEDAKKSLNSQEIIYLPEELQVVWSNVNPNGEFDVKALEPILDYIQSYETLNAKKIVVQGELSAMIHTIQWAKLNGIPTYYATTERISKDVEGEDGTIQTIKTFEHVQFRPFPAL